MATNDWEGRAFERVALRVETPVLDTRTGRFLSGRTRDVSLNGVFIEASEYPPVGALVDIFLGGVGIGAQVIGRVVRSAGDGFAAMFTGDTSSVRNLLG